MITTKEVKIKIPEEFSSEYIEQELSKLNNDILSWAVTGYDDEFYIVNAAVVYQ